MRGRWEVADSRRPDKPGPRYASLRRAAALLESSRPRGRYFLRWVGDAEDDAND